jgi:putative transposase
MKPKRYTDEQIAFVLRQAESDTAVAAICRKLGVAEPTFYRWKKHFAGVGTVEIRRLKQLEGKRLLPTALRLGARIG